VLCLFTSLTDDNPSVFAVFAQLIIPLVLTAASLAIAFLSFRTSQKAKDIADGALRAEGIRADDEKARVEKARIDDYNTRLDAQLIQLVETLGEYSAESASWVYRATEIEMGWGGDPDDIIFPEKPSTGRLTARMQAAMLVAREDDRVHLAQADGYIRVMLKSGSFWKTPGRTRFMMETIRKWRDGSISGKVFKNRILRKRKSMELDRDGIPNTPKERPTPAEEESEN
jgi:hypothetical protein